ncbi:MAG: tetratricopeptide repeat protein [Proteobacteria bacterium]|nr:tetratricopeptide repeat protein [Pseudomonadota bacterium]
MKRYLIEIIVILIISASYGFATYQRNFIWKNGLSLWSDVIRKSSEKARPYNNLGRAHLVEKKFFQAIPYFKTALKHNPYFSYAHFNLGIAYQGLCQYDNAIAEYKKALYGTRQPYFAELHNNLGVCCFNKGWIDMAVEEFRGAININPEFSDAIYNLRIALSHIEK